MIARDWSQELREYQKHAEEYNRKNPMPLAPAPVAGSCPSCGYCRHCGRGGTLAQTVQRWGMQS